MPILNMYWYLHNFKSFEFEFVPLQYFSGLLGLRLCVRPVAPLELPGFVFCRLNYRFRSVIVIGFFRAQRTMEKNF
jgi:hypothetical protein